MNMDRHYNVVLIMTDQQRWDMMGCAGSPWMHTPCLDRLAESGCRFANAFTTTPVCTPARAGLFTGMYGSSSGAWANQLSPHRHVAFLGEHLRDHGIAAGYIGKWHLDGPAGGYYGRGEPDGGFDPEYWYDGRRFIEEVGEEGFRKWYQGRGLTEHDCWGARVADRAIRFLEEHHRDEQPFVLVVSFDEPHGPSSAPERFYKLYEGSTRPWQPNMADRLEGKPETHRAMCEAWGSRRHMPPDGQDPNNNPRYYGATSFADEQVGRVVEAVDRLCGQNTAVFFTSDHGDHQGAHGMLGKGMTMYEETVRVPFLARVPGLTRPGSVSEALVSHIDLAPTICRLVGIPPHEQFQGRDMLEVLADPAEAGPEAVFIEFNRFGLPHHHWWGLVPIRCIRTRRYKLVLNLLDIDELYDLGADPGEMVNRIDDPALRSLRDELHDRLLAWMRDRRDPFRGQGWYARPWRPGKRLDPCPPPPRR